MAIETPRYEVLKKFGKIELRKYDGYVTASVKVTADNYNTAGNRAFRQLADYIFGNNTKKAKIAMTAPVVSQKSAESEKIAMTAPVITSKSGNETYTISFTMPSQYSMQDLPRPNNDAVKLKEVPSHKVAVIRFSGYTTDGKINKMANKLREWAKQQQVRLNGEFVVSRYNPPWIPGFLRKNEVSFHVK